MIRKILADVNPADLVNFSALPPPDGVIPNLVDPYTAGPVIIKVGSILVALMILFVVARIYVKMCINRKMHWDDCQAPVGPRFLTC